MDLPESALVEGCIRGIREAWACLIERYQVELETYLRRLLRRRGIKDENMPSIIISNLWSEQLNRKRLVTFETERGTLRTYLRGLARIHVLRWLRERASIRDREKEAMRRSPEVIADGEAWQALMLADFFDQVSRAEREYLRAELFEEGLARDLQPPLAANTRQRRHRALQKLSRVLGLAEGSRTGR
jgi:hypothetical protein